MLIVMDEKEVLELKARRKIEYDKDMDAIDRVLGLLNKDGSAPQITDVSSANGAIPVLKPKIRTKPKKGTGNRTGMRALVKRHRGELPDKFTKYDVKSLIIKYDPKMEGKINENSLSGVMRIMVREGFSRILVNATGRKAAVFEKARRN
jgi:hypothetical protein